MQFLNYINNILKLHLISVYPIDKSHMLSNLYSFHMLDDKLHILDLLSGRI